MTKKVKRPIWCEYPGAARPFFGCWSLLDGLVVSENFCKKCDCYKQRNGE